MKDSIFFPKFFAKCRKAEEQLTSLSENFVKSEIIGLSAVFVFYTEMSPEESDLMIPLMSFANRDLNTHIHANGEYLVVEFV